MLTETFTLDFICAVEDKPFRVLFERIVPGTLFSIKSIDKVLHNSNHSANTAEDKMKEINIDSVLLAGLKCPYCADTKGFVSCKNCNQRICKGKTGRFIFRCAPSCGTFGLMSAGLTSLLVNSQQNNNASNKKLQSPAKRLPSNRDNGTSLIIRK